ncbi:MAG: hypothetical protein JEY79_10835 [Pseudodesulfovibrio sp.]|nr:hypothetical protein [Pseudodesulfovibrio sp.]
MDRRMYSRNSLINPIPCLCQIGQDEPVLGYVKNVSMMGVMVELPDIKERLMVECCQCVVFTECESESGCLFSGMVGTLNWLYKNFAGISFKQPIKDSNNELRAWLEEHGHLFERAM